MAKSTTRCTNKLDFPESTLLLEQLGFQVYLDLVLVKMHPKAPESIRFLAHLLDVGDVGKITRNNVAHFWAGILAHPLMAFGDSPSSENIVNEVFDMVRFVTSRGLFPILSFAWIHCANGPFR